jgi:hypothetical protein
MESRRDCDQDVGQAGYDGQTNGDGALKEHFEIF